MDRISFFILLTSFLSGSESGCPSMCNCSETSVLCIQKDLESIPSFESLLNDPVIIDLSGNKINMIDSDDFSFDRSDRVIEIYLNNTELLDIDSEAFDELENLQELYLGDNLLNSLPETLIEDLPNMILLDISNNHFSGDMPKIISNSLEVLAVANSKITNVPVDALTYLPNIKMLLLQQNNINSIDPIAFETVNKNSFFVRLSYNVWDCSCDNIALFEYLAQRKFIDTSEPYQCLGEGEKYITVYAKGVIENFKSKCVSQILKNQVIKDLSIFKENRVITETEQQLEEKEMEVVRNRDKAYSLVKEINKTSDESDESEDSYDESISIDYASEEDEEPWDEQADGFVRKIEYTKADNEVDITEYEEPVGPNFTFNINLGTFIAILCSFVIGVLFGFCINQLASTMRYRSLETSDSRTKLILP